MKKTKFIIAAILILAMSLTTYLYFRKQTVENIPKRAILVWEYRNEIEKEVENNV